MPSQSTSIRRAARALVVQEEGTGKQLLREPLPRSGEEPRLHAFYNKGEGHLEAAAGLLEDLTPEFVLLSTATTPMVLAPATPGDVLVDAEPLDRVLALAPPAVVHVPGVESPLTIRIDTTVIHVDLDLLVCGCGQDPHGVSSPLVFCACGERRHRDCWRARDVCPGCAAPAPVTCPVCGERGPGTFADAPPRRCAGCQACYHLDCISGKGACPLCNGTMPS